MLLEFQILTVGMQDLLNLRALVNLPCVPTSFPFGGDTQFVSSIDVGQTTLQAGPSPQNLVLNTVLANGDIGPPPAGAFTVTVTPVRLIQQITVNLAPLAAMQASGEDQCNTAPHPLTILFTLSMTVDSKGATSFCANVDDAKGLEFIGNTIIEDIVKQFIKANLSNCTGFDLNQLLHDAQLPPLPTVVNAGLAISADGNSLAIRFETDSPDQSQAADWQTFYSGGYLNLLSDNEWAFFLPQELIGTRIQKMVATNLTGDSKFSLQSGVEIQWTPDGTTPVFTIKFSGEVSHACGFVDLSADVTVTITLSVPEENVLRTEADISVSIGFLEKTKCAFLLATSWPVLGSSLFITGKIPWYGFVTGFAGGPVVMFTGIVIYLSGDAPAKQVPPQPDWIQVTDTRSYQDAPFPTSTGNFVSGLALGGIAALGDGLLLTGILHLAAVTPTRTQLATGVEQPPFQWELANPCNSPTDAFADATIAIGATAPDVKPQQLLIPLQICVAQTYADADPDGKYGFFWGGTDDTDFTVQVRSDQAPFDYPAEVLILSSNGCRLITIPPPGPPPKGPQTAKEVAEYFAWKAGHCLKAQSIWNIIGMFNPKWNVDPPPEQSVAQSWWVEATGLDPSEPVELLDQNGVALGSARATPAGRVELSAFLENAGPDTGITLGRNGVRLSPGEYLRRTSALPIPTEPPPGELVINQALMVATSEIVLPAPARQILLDYRAGRPSLIAFTEAGEHVVRVSNPLRPRVVAAAVKPLCGPTADLISRVSLSGQTYELRSNRLDVFDSTGCLVQTIAVQDAYGLAVTLNRLAIASKEGVAVFALCGAANPKLLGTLPHHGFAQIGRARVAGSRNVIYAEAEGHYRVLDISDPAAPLELARYRARPWFVGGSRLGRLFARLNEARTRARIYTLWDTASGFEKPPRVSDIWPGR